MKTLPTREVATSRCQNDGALEKLVALDKQNQAKPGNNSNVVITDRNDQQEHACVAVNETRSRIPNASRPNDDVVAQKVYYPDYHPSGNTGVADIGMEIVVPDLVDDDEMTQITMLTFDNMYPSRSMPVASSVPSYPMAKAQTIVEEEATTATEQDMTESTTSYSSSSSSSSRPTAAASSVGGGDSNSIVSLRSQLAKLKEENELLQQLEMAKQEAKRLQKLREQNELLEEIESLQAENRSLLSKENNNESCAEELASVKQLEALKAENAALKSKRVTTASVEETIVSKTKIERSQQKPKVEQKKEAERDQRLKEEKLKLERQKGARKLAATTSYAINGVPVKRKEKKQQRLSTRSKTSKDSSSKNSKTRKSSRHSAKVAPADTKKRSSRSSSQKVTANNNGTTGTLFAVTVPKGVRPNQTFNAQVNGQKYLVTCPPNAKPGQTIRVPIKLRNQKQSTLYAVTVPHGVRPNQRFEFIVNGRTLIATCPPNVKGGQSIYVPVLM